MKILISQLADLNRKDFHCHNEDSSMCLSIQVPVKDPATGETKDKVTAFIVERSFGGVSK